MMRKSGYIKLFWLGLGIYGLGLGVGLSIKLRVTVRGTVRAMIEVNMSPVLKLCVTDSTRRNILLQQ